MILICKMCGKNFEGSPQTKFCSDCRKIRNSVKKRDYLKENLQYLKDNQVMTALENATKIAEMEAERQAHKGLVLRRCKSCGKDYWVKSGDSYLCPECAENARKDGVHVNRVCAICGVTFLGYPRSKYCPACREEAKKLSYKRYKQQKKAGNIRQIGSTDICQNCGKPYIVTSGLQRYCPDCSQYVVAENIRAHKREYMARNREYFDALKKEYRTGRRVCVICGKTFNSPTSTTVCSADCAAEQMRRSHVRSMVNQGRTKPVRILGPRGPVNPQSGIPGIHYHPKTGKWELVVKKQYCGLYNTVTEANEERERILKLIDEIKEEDK